MSEPFTLTAIPCVPKEASPKGHLEFIRFIGDNSHEIQKGSGVNTATIADDFMKFLDKTTAEDLLLRLRPGEQVLFPGFLGY